jgi:hypothetical protein
MSARRTRVLVFGVAAVAACEGQPAASGIGEPIQVVGGQFIAGDLPGEPPPPMPDGGDDAGAPSSSGPSITAMNFSSIDVFPGQAGKGVSGRTSGAAAVGVRFADIGTGYWIVPVAEQEPQFPGENNFRFSANFDADDPPGFHSLRFVGIDGSGRAGAQAETSLCIAGRVPDNFHSCVPATPPPSAVVSLRWDTNFDVDLHVFSPTGLDINPKSHPLGEVLEAGAVPDPKAPHIDRDSLGSCVPDGLRQEDLVFQDPPPPGAYDIYADPFAPCGQASVRFQLTIYKVAGTCPSCALQPAFTQRGELLASQVTGGSSIGLFITEIPF